MTLPNQKLSIIFIKSLISLLLSVLFYFAIHELSHVITLLLCNGELSELSLSLLYVGGYVEPKHISIVAMSSLIFPTILSCILFFFKNFYISAYYLGFTFPTILNAILGVFAICFDNTDTRSTYDVALAYDFASIPNLIVIFTALIAVLNIILLLLKIKEFVRAT